MLASSQPIPDRRSLGCSGGQHRTNTSLSIKSLPHDSLEKLQKCFPGGSQHGIHAKRKFDLNALEVTDPLYKMLTQPSVLQVRDLLISPNFPALR